MTKDRESNLMLMILLLGTGILYSLWSIRTSLQETNKMLKQLQNDVWMFRDYDK